MNGRAIQGGGWSDVTGDFCYSVCPSMNLKAVYLLLSISRILVWFKSINSAYDTWYFPVKITYFVCHFFQFATSLRLNIPFRINLWMTFFIRNKNTFEDFSSFFFEKIYSLLPPQCNHMHAMTTKIYKECSLCFAGFIKIFALKLQKFFETMNFLWLLWFIQLKKMKSIISHRPPFPYFSIFRYFKNIYFCRRTYKLYK